MQLTKYFKLVPIVFLVLILLSGCVEQNRYLMGVSTTPNEISASEDFRLYFSIKNPEKFAFLPAIEILLPEGVELTKYHDKRRLTLEQIEPSQEKNYFLDVSTNDSISSLQEITITVNLYRSDKYEKIIETQSTSVKVRRSA